jgi:hypothetical protein
MLHQGIGMALLAMRHSILGMRQGFSHMLIGSDGKPAEERKTDKRGNRRHSQYSTMDSLCHGFLLSG